MLKKATRAAGFTTLLMLAAPGLAFLPGCTDLSESPTSSVSPDNFYRTNEEVIAGLAAVYRTMRDVTDNYWYVSEVSSDEFVVPTRVGNDWLDGGKWLDMHRQTYAPASPASLANINDAWNNLFTGVARANIVLAAMENVNVANKAIIQAELRTLRAYYYFLLQDLFGGVPVVTDVEIKARPQNTRAEVMKFIEDELNATRLVLPASWPPEMNGRVTSGAANAILASLYINAEVFGGTVTATGLTKGPVRWTDALAAADRVLNATPAGLYALETNWQKNFTADNGTSKEIIMAAKMLAASGPDLGLNFMMRTLHYNSLSSQTPWNGFATIAETYNSFDPADIRRNIFLSGPQTNLETGATAFKRDNVTPLDFTVGISDPTQAAENEGIRVMKWPLDPNKDGVNNGNDYGTFRLAEIILIRAEALNELARTPEAIVELNRVRARVFSPAKPTTAVAQAQVRDAIFAERLWELTAESKRRQDLIRAGKFLLPWSFKLLPTEPAGTVRPAYKILFPIPQTQIETNPLLKQNPGY